MVSYYELISIDDKEGEDEEDEDESEQEDQGSYFVDRKKLEMEEVKGPGDKSHESQHPEAEVGEEPQQNHEPKFDLKSRESREVLDELCEKCEQKIEDIDDELDPE
jgi:hypothetical protein